MTVLRQRMLEDMQVRNLSGGTQQVYLQHISRFALNITDVGTGFQEVDGKGVPQRMGLRELAAAPGLPARAVDHAATRRAAWAITRKEPVLRAAHPPPVAQNRQQLRREHHVAVPLPFPLDDAEDHPLAINRRHGQASVDTQIRPLVDT